MSENTSFPVVPFDKQYNYVYDWDIELLSAVDEKIRVIPKSVDVINKDNDYIKNTVPVTLLKMAVRKKDIFKLTDNEKKDLKKGDVLVFNREDRIVVHRIYDIYSTGGEIFFKTKGDFNKDPDEYLTETSEVIGIVKAKIKYIGYPTVILYEKFGS